MKTFFAIACILGCRLMCPCAAVSQQEAVFHGKNVSAWTEQLAAPDARVRWYATYALGQLGPKAADAAEPLAEVLGNLTGHEYVRCGAAWALGRLQSRAEPVVAVLVASLDSRLPSVRRQAAQALGRLSQLGRPALRRLARSMEDPDPVVAVYAAAALWQVARHEPAAAKLIAMTGHEDTSAAYQAVAALGRLGLRSEASLDALTAALGYAEADVPRAAARALGRLGPSVVPKLQSVLADGDSRTVLGTVEALGWLGPEIEPLLIELLQYKSPAVRRAAARALERIRDE